MNKVFSKEKLSNVLDHFDTVILEAKPKLLEIADALAVLKAEKYPRDTLAAYLNKCQVQYGLPPGLVLELERWRDG